MFPKTNLFSVKSCLGREAVEASFSWYGPVALRIGGMSEMLG